ncbi:hypothetical protein HKD37_12G034971 [Glycine soja]|nr:hypothetical protein JHK86_034589 [Glycine max]KAH1222620.1 hypothetical protein GmHk_12G035728 [Glycine max]
MNHNNRQIRIKIKEKKRKEPIQEKRIATKIKKGKDYALARNLTSEPSKNFYWKLYKTHSQIGQSSTANATWAQATQYRSA